MAEGPTHGPSADTQVNFREGCWLIVDFMPPLWADNNKNCPSGVSHLVLGSRDQ